MSLQYNYFAGGPKVAPPRLTKPSRKVAISFVLRPPLMGLVIGIFLIFLGQLEASLINAKSVEFRDVNKAIASARDGDTVSIPAGAAVWSEMLDVRKNVILQGAGSGRTTITDNLVRARSANSLIRFFVDKDIPFGLRGVILSQGSDSGATQEGIVAVFGGTRGTTNPAIRGISTQLRITDVVFNYTNDLRAVMIRVTDAIGVVDHCTFNTARQFITIYHPSWNGGSYGNGSWADDPNWGSSRFLFIEDCVVNYTGALRVMYGTDGDRGARFVVRHCTFNNSGIAAHGSEASGRGTKQIEVYDNTFNATKSSAIFQQVRSGSALMHDNVLNGYSKGMAFKVYRFTDIKRHWGGATGANPYDVNAKDGPLGGSLYEKGSHTGPDNSHTLIDSIKNWSPNQWVSDGFAYVITNISRQTSPSYTVSNTSNQINFEQQNLARAIYPSLYFNHGDHYEIRKVLVALDQCGQGKGVLKSGTDYTPAAFPNTVLEPCYGWNNWTDAAHTAQLDFNIKTPTMKEGRDYFNRTAKPGYTPYVYPHPLVGKTPGVRAVGNRESARH